MTDKTPAGQDLEVPGRKSHWIEGGVLAAVCALVIGVYAYTSCSSYLTALSLNAGDAYYNLLVQGFRAGQLNLKKEAPPGLTQLADPYDPAANAQYGLNDLSYYKGKLYLYFGVTPAVVLFWPYVALTGHYLPQKDAVFIFCAIGFLASASLLCGLWRRYFAGLNVTVAAAGVLGLGLATGIPLLLARCDVYEACLSCGYALTMLALAAIWKAQHEQRQRNWWLGAASLAYGLAVGARPSLLFGAIILLVPVAQAWRERRRVLGPLLAAAGPLMLIGGGLMLYNALRFDSALQFGNRYQLAGQSQVAGRFFSIRFLWTNFRAFFLMPANWSGRFPFVRDNTAPLLPAGYLGIEPQVFGVLTSIPLVWLALLAPLVWRRRSLAARSILCGFLAAVAVLFGTAALTICLYMSANNRYEVEFLPALVLLAVVGLLGLERTLVTPGAWLAERPVWRRTVRGGWILLLCVSVAFNIFASVGRCAEAHDSLGAALGQLGRVPEAIGQFEQALRLNPDFAQAHNNLGVALRHRGREQEAIGQFEEALRLQPDYANADNNLGVALMDGGRVDEAIRHYQHVLLLHPEHVSARYNLGICQLHTGRIPEAIQQFTRVLQLQPGNADAECNLGVALSQTGNVRAAINHYEQALRIDPGSVGAHYNLGIALSQLDRKTEAMAQWEQVLRLNPDHAEAHNNLGVAWSQLGRASEAIAHWEAAIRLKPDYDEAHNNLGVALARIGRLADAIRHYEQALRINPNYAEAHNNLGAVLEQAGRVPDAVAQYELALRLQPDFEAARQNLARLRAVGQK